MFRTIVATFALCAILLPSALAEDHVLRWDLSTSNPACYAGSGHASVVFNNRMWVMGGWFSGQPYSNSVWSSVDGVSWTQETPSAEWGPRSNLRCVVHDGRMWVIGGNPAMGQWNDDVWSSENGVIWQLETADRNVTGGGRIVVFNGKIWDIGGGSSRIRVWSSSNGVDWVESVWTWPDPRPLLRNGHTCVVHNGRMWVTGGVFVQSFPYPPGAEYTYYSDVWSTADGVHWEEATTSAPWQSRSGLESVVRDGRIWIIGGARESDGPPTHFNDAWSSADGTTWTLETVGPWGYRSSFTTVFLNDRIYLIGGASYHDVWNYGWHDPLPPAKAHGDAWNLLSLARRASASSYRSRLSCLPQSHRLDQFGILASDLRRK